MAAEQGFAIAQENLDVLEGLGAPSGDAEEAGRNNKPLYLSHTVNGNGVSISFSGGQSWFIVLIFIAFIVVILGEMFRSPNSEFKKAPLTKRTAIRASRAIGVIGLTVIIYGFEYAVLIGLSTALNMGVWEIIGVPAFLLFLAPILAARHVLSYFPGGTRDRTATPGGIHET